MRSRYYTRIQSKRSIYGLYHLPQVAKHYFTSICAVELVQFREGRGLYDLSGLDLELKWVMKTVNVNIYYIVLR